MKYISILFIVFASLTGLFSQANPTINPEISYNPNAKTDTAKRSINAEAIGKIGQAKISIRYHSPGVRGRVIWDSLVPYGKIWVTGAHNATSIESDKDFMINNVRIPKGKYALFTIPQKDKWTVIINKNPNQHQADKYLEAEDVLRFQVKPKHSGKIVERLQYFIENKKNSKGVISMAWEKIKIHFDIIIQE